VNFDFCSLLILLCVIGNFVKILLWIHRARVGSLGSSGLGQEVVASSEAEECSRVIL